MNFHFPDSHKSKNEKEKKNQGGKTIFNPRKYERPGFTIDQIVEMKQTFDLFDRDKGGTLSFNELRDAMQILGFIKDDESALAKVIDQLDQNNDKNLDFDEFMDIMFANIAEKDTDKDLEKILVILNFCQMMMKRMLQEVLQKLFINDPNHLRVIRKVIRDKIVIKIKYQYKCQEIQLKKLEKMLKMKIQSKCQKEQIEMMMGKLDSMILNKKQNGKMRKHKMSLQLGHQKQKYQILQSKTCQGMRIFDSAQSQNYNYFKHNKLIMEYNYKSSFKYQRNNIQKHFVF